jgi:cysteinyl-tRNA synthetase
MSKSLGNYFTVRDLLAKGFTGREIRYLLLKAHYRESFNFTLDDLQGARTALGRLDESLGKLREAAAGATAPPDENLLQQFAAALDDDFNVSAAWGAIFEWVRHNNRLAASNELRPEQAAAGVAAWQKIVSVVGLAPIEAAGIPSHWLALLEQREAARKAKDFKRADALRAQLKSDGWIIEDTPKGAKLKQL